MTHFERFMKYFPGKNTFQVFGDSDKLVPMVLQNPTPENLVSLNKKGYGIFMTINRTDGQGRKKENVTQVRAVFADLDGESPNPALDDGCHLLVESSKGKYHAYFFCTPSFPLEGFYGVQRAIALKYNSDQSVSDLGRVLRVPGFLHKKKIPQPVQIVFANPIKNLISYEEAVEKWPPKIEKPWTAPRYKAATEGEGIDVGITPAEALMKYGWVHASGNNFTRPGKRHGVSASILESGHAYIFTSSTCLKPMSSADAFEIEAQYSFGGNKSICAKHFIDKNKQI